MTFLLISFIAGVLTILAPCILPLLPVIVGRSISDTTLSKRRVFTVIISLGLSVIIFTLVLKASTIFIDIPQDFWKYISGGIIFIFGLVTLFPDLWESLPFNSKVNEESNKVLMSGYQKDNIWGDIIVGASLGPIFSACSPTYFVILATVLPASPVLGMVYLLTYTVGLCLALFIVAILGQKVMTKLGVVSDPRGWFKRTLGIIFILVAIGIFSGYDKKLQVSILDAGFLDVTKIEQSLLDKSEKKESNEDVEMDPISLAISNMDEEGMEPKKMPETKTFLTLKEKSQMLTPAPDISTPDGFINTLGKPISIAEFRGKKVVLLDIWTYSCINCQRTLPYLNSWYEKYQDKGLVIIGLHTPEFAFERVLKNVEKAVKDFGIKYPVVLDNDFSTWVAYKNQYWPRKYLIDIDGYISYDHAGEGDYDGTEEAIVKALKERAERLGLDVETGNPQTDPKDKIVVEYNKVRSPEIYFGSARNDRLGNGDTGVSGEQNLAIPSEIYKNQLYLGGLWNITPEHAEGAPQGEIVFKYEAKNVYMVASGESAEVEVYLDGVLKDTIVVSNETIYQLIQGNDYGIHTMMLKVKSGKLKAFTFTFG